MKQYFASFISLTLVAALLLQLGFNMALLSAYELNTEYFVTELCVQKDIKENTCQGHCILKEQMLKSSATSSDIPNSLFQTVDLDLFIPSMLRFDLKQLTSEHILSISPINLKDDNRRGVFHPPKV